MTKGQFNHRIQKMEEVITLLSDAYTKLKKLEDYNPNWSLLCDISTAIDHTKERIKIETKQFSCKHTEIVDNSWVHPHNGDEVVQINCKHCGMRLPESRRK